MTEFAAALLAVDGASCVVLADGARFAVRSRRTPTLTWRLTVTNGLDRLWDVELDEAACARHRRATALGEASSHSHRADTAGGDWAAYFGRVRRGLRGGGDFVSLHFSSSGAGGGDAAGAACTLTIYASDGGSSGGTDGVAAYAAGGAGPIDGSGGSAAAGGTVAHAYRLELREGRDMQLRMSRVFLDTVSTVSKLQDQLHEAMDALRRANETARAAALSRQAHGDAAGAAVNSPSGAAQLFRTAGGGGAADHQQQQQQAAAAAGHKRPARSLLNPSYTRKRARGAVLASDALSSDDEED